MKITRNTFIKYKHRRTPTGERIIIGLVVSFMLFVAADGFFEWGVIDRPNLEVNHGTEIK